MNDDTASARALHAAIYIDLDRRLRESPFGGGAAEAHGILCALVCRDVPPAQLRAAAAKAGLRPTAADDIEAIDGLYALITRDLRAMDFPFELMLPGEDAGAAVYAVAVTDWCGGFARGFLYDGEGALADCPPASREAFGDIVEISALEAPAAATDSAAGVRLADLTDDDDDDAPLTEEEALNSLAHIEEYLRMATQLIFEELNPPPPPSSAAPRGSFAL